MKIEFINKNKIEGTIDVYYSTLDTLLNTYAIMPIRFIDKRYKTLNSKHGQPYYIEINLITYEMNNITVCNLGIFNTKKRSLIGGCICRASIIDHLYETYNVE